MERQPASTGRDSGGARRWVFHARHDLTATAPHRPVPALGGGGVRSASASSDIRLDGSAGGQSIRTALTLSLLTGRPFRLDRIPSGLRDRDLRAIEAALAVCGGEAVGASIGSRSLTFRPGAVRPRDLDLDSGPGPAWLLLSMLHMPLALRADGPVRLRLSGSTGDASAPFLAANWRDHMTALGLTVGLRNRADDPSAGSCDRLDAWIEPDTPRPLAHADRGPLIRLHAQVVGADPGQSGRLIDHVSTALAARGLSAEFSIADRSGPGCALVLTSEHAGCVPCTFVAPAASGSLIEAADSAVASLLAHLDSPGVLDPHSASQILIASALADGPSTFTVSAITPRLLATAATIRAFLPRPIRVDGSPGGPGRVSV